jgi:hypothetical protein
MKFLVSLAAIAALIAPATAEAHSDCCSCNHAQTAVSVGTPAVTVGWVWVVANRARHIRAHWFHPTHGREFTNHVGGRPTVRPYAHANWVSGHWAGKRRTRHWVSGRWTPQTKKAQTQTKRQPRRSQTKSQPRQNRQRNR